MGRGWAVKGSFGGGVGLCREAGISVFGVGGLTISRGGVDPDLLASRAAVSSRIVLNSPEVIVGNVSSVVTGMAAGEMTGKLDVNISPKTGLSKNSTSESRRFIIGMPVFSGTGGRSLARVAGFAGSGIVTARGMVLGCRMVRSIGFNGGDGCGDGGNFSSATGAATAGFRSSGATVFFAANCSLELLDARVGILLSPDLAIGRDGSTPEILDVAKSNKLGPFVAPLEPKLGFLNPIFDSVRESGPFDPILDFLIAILDSDRESGPIDPILDFLGPSFDSASASCPLDPSLDSALDSPVDSALDDGLEPGSGDLALKNVKSFSLLTVLFRRSTVYLALAFAMKLFEFLRRLRFGSSSN